MGDLFLSVRKGEKEREEEGERRREKEREGERRREKEKEGEGTWRGKVTTVATILAMAPIMKNSMGVISYPRRFTLLSYKQKEKKKKRKRKEKENWVV